jgi:hypothetical protein
MAERFVPEIAGGGPKGFRPKRGSRNGRIFGQNGSGPQGLDEANASVDLFGRLAGQPAEEVDPDIGRFITRFAQIPNGRDEMIVVDFSAGRRLTVGVDCFKPESERPESGPEQHPRQVWGDVPKVKSVRTVEREVRMTTDDGVEQGQGQGRGIHEKGVVID